MFQFTRPRGGAISTSHRQNGTCRFNSHAPVGARSAVREVSGLVHVSIHTPPWGRDCGSGSTLLAAQFQFTRPRGGAIRPRPKITASTSFNSHAPVGARSNPSWYVDGDNRFQFTRPRGGAILSTYPSRHQASFNSHAPVGARS